MELRQRTKATDSADAVSRAAREFLRTCRLRELTLMAGQLDYDEQAWRALDEAELSGPRYRKCHSGHGSNRRQRAGRGAGHRTDRCGRRATKHGPYWARHTD